MVRGDLAATHMTLTIMATLPPSPQPPVVGVSWDIRSGAV